MGSDALHPAPELPCSARTVYRLADGVQVRKEKFGLLFYNYRGPRLYFLPTKDLLGEGFFQGQQPLEKLVEAIERKAGHPRQELTVHLAQILQQLQIKGLIHGESIC